MASKIPSLYVLENSTPVTKPACLEAFGALESREQKYLHYLSQASWYGSTVCLFQSSLEAPAIFVILDNYFRDNPTAFDKPESVADEDFQAFLVYCGGFYANMGNYKGFGDTKIVPGCSEEDFETILSRGPKFAMVKSIYEKVKRKIFSLNENELKLGLGGDEGVTSYFSSNCVRPDAEKVEAFMQSSKVYAENTRLIKCQEDGKDKYTILLASEETSPNAELKKELEGSMFEVKKGDYAPLMKRINFYLEKSLEFVSNDNEKLMIENYIESFKTGSLEKHKDGSRYWIKNKGPIVECYIGFIETYRDPFGVRAEFEGFVAVVNKPVSAKFGNLVENAEKILPELPWSTEFEKDKFLRPDFTSLDVITYGGSGIPSGINIPNYDDIRSRIINLRCILLNFQAGQKILKEPFVSQ